MSYSAELKELKQQEHFQRIFATQILDKYSPFMADNAKQENARHSQMLLNIYEQKIAQLEPLAQKEQQEQIINAVINAVINQDECISGIIEKSQ